MHRAARAPIALLLVAAFAGAPLVAAQCAVECEAATAGASAAGSPAHAGHHHAHGPIARLHIGETPAPCGHDHTGIVGVTASSGGDGLWARTPALAVAVLLFTLPPAAAPWARHDLRNASPPGGALRSVSSPLRV